VTLWGLDNIEAEDFQGATSLTALISNGDMSSIEEGAFKGCTNLKKVEINGNTTSIGDKAFEDCNALTDGDIIWVRLQIWELFLLLVVKISRV